MGVAMQMDTNSTEFYKFQMFNILFIWMMLFGSVAYFYYVIRVFDTLLDISSRKGVPVERFGANRGYWAVVTGCTDGIGKEAALYLAEHGFNIVMLSRTPKKLDEVELELVSKGVQVKKYAVDFTKTTPKQWADIKDILDSVPVSILMNNVGICQPDPKYFDEVDIDLCNNMIEINICTMMDITRMVVPQMRERQNGLILNLGSFADLRTMPFMSVYAATKGFVKTWSQSLAQELSPEGIMVTHILSFWVTSKMSGYREPTFSVPSPKTYAHAIFNNLGLSCGSIDAYTSIPYYPHSILNFIISCLWDPRHAEGVHYNICQNLYKLSILRIERRRLRRLAREKDEKLKLGQEQEQDQGVEVDNSKEG